MFLISVIGAFFQNPQGQCQGRCSSLYRWVFGLDLNREQESIILIWSGNELHRGPERRGRWVNGGWRCGWRYGGGQRGMEERDQNRHCNSWGLCLLETELDGNVTQGRNQNEEEGAQDRGLRHTCHHGRWDPERWDGNQFKSVWMVPVVENQ